MTLILAVLVLSATAAAGLGLAWCHMQGRRVRLPVGLAHATGGVIGVVLLTAAALAAGTDYRLNSALICLTLALIGGAFILIFRLEGDSAPGFMIGLHALAAISALVLVWLAVLGE